MLLRFFVVVLLCFHQVTCTRAQSDANELVNEEIDGQTPLQPDSCRPVLLVSTLDGLVTALDVRNYGMTLWAMYTSNSPLLQSTLHNMEVHSGDIAFRLLPSLDGNLYMYNDAITQGIPVNTDNLLSHSIRLGPDLIVGGKEIISYGIDYITGEVLYICSPLGCRNLSDATASSNRIVIRRITQIVRAVNASSGSERWNVTVGENQVLLSSEAQCEDEEDCYEQGSDLSPCYLGVKLIPPEGVVYFYDKRSPSEVVWQRKLDSPLAKVWMIGGNRISELSLFDPEVVPALANVKLHHSESHDSSPVVTSMIYVGYYNNEPYVIPSDEEKQSLALSVSNSLPTSHRGRIYLPSASGDTYRLPLLENFKGKCTECETCSSNEMHAVLQTNARPDNGWYLFNYKFGTALQRWKRWEKHLAGREPSLDQQIFPHRIQFVDLSYLWTEMIILTVILSTSAYAVVLFYFIRLYFSKSLPLREDNSIPTENRGSMTDRNLSTGSKCPIEFTSRFRSDFQTIRCIGRGGFGVVWECKNLLDENTYAVKRIAIPDREHAKEKVIREVKALAKLDHPGIVRYYNSWFEELPLNWKETNEAAVENCSGATQTTLSETMSELVGTTATTTTSCSKAHVLERLARKNGFLRPFASSTAISQQRSTLGSVASSGSVEDSHNQLTFSSKDRPSEDGCLLLSSLTRRLAPPEKSSSCEIVFQNSAASQIQTVNGDEQHAAEVERKEEDEESSSSEDTRITKKHKKSCDKLRNKELQTPLSKAFLFIQMQLCRKDTLKEWLNAHVEHRDEPLMIDWFSQILSAVKYVHDCGIIHRDLKPTNIFFSLDDHVKIGDFGLATEILSTSSSDDEADCVRGGRWHTKNVGTGLYMSPEQEFCDSYTSKVDIYALGLVFVELMLPFHTEMERITVLTNFKKLRFPPEFLDINSPKVDLVKKMLSFDPVQRPSCSEILRSEIFCPRPESQAVAVR